ncbi:MAG TPA: NAD-dependent epimerase/dehydratase family protein [Streptosporangiaceae bacterium]|nr:NAD-dependent epimerase/dehydratase family protein [Streptosporangiaceae bacterium]
MARYLVTGGAGFIGSHLTEKLLERGHDVVVLDNLSGGTRDRVPGTATLIVGSVADERLVAEVFTSFQFNGVFHLAAFAAEGISHAVKRHNYVTNMLGSVNLINAALASKLDFFGFASSVAVYGRAEPPMRERDQPIPVDSYGNAKLAVERELDITMRLQGLPYFALRMHNVYGEWQNMSDPYRNAVAIFLNQVMRGEPISVYGDGGQIRAFTYVGDIVGTFLASAERRDAWGHVLNVGSSATSTVLNLAHIVRDVMGAPNHPIVHLPARHEVHRAYTDSAWARKLLGEWPETDLRAGLAKTAKWARAHGPADLVSNLELEVPQERSAAWVGWIQDRLGGTESGSERRAAGT